MSIQAMAWAMSQQAVTNASERHVLLCLANYADEQGRGAFPSVARLVRDTGLSERTIQYKLSSLEQQGILSSGNRAVVAAYITRPDHRPSVYDINMGRGATTAPGIERGANDNTTGCKQQQNGVQTTTERGAPVAPDTSLEPSIEPSIEPIKPKRAEAKEKFNPVSAKPTNVSARIWEMWCSHRAEIKKPITKGACDLVRAELEQHPNPDAVIILSIKNQWTGLFPEKVPAQSARLERHGDFDKRDYSEGVGADGRF